MDNFEKAMLVLALCMGATIVGFGSILLFFYLQLIIQQIDQLGNLLGYSDLIPVDFFRDWFVAIFFILLFAFLIIFPLDHIKVKRRLKKIEQSSNGE